MTYRAALIGSVVGMILLAGFVFVAIADGSLVNHEEVAGKKHRLRVTQAERTDADVNVDVQR